MVIEIVSCFVQLLRLKLGFLALAKCSRFFMHPLEA